MARHSGLKCERGVLPYAVLGSLSLQLTAVTAKMTLEVNELDHGSCSLRHGRDTSYWLAQRPGSLTHMEEFTLTVVYEPVEEGWVQARIAELPAVITVGHDHDEARALVVDALREYLLANAAQQAAAPGEEREELTVLLRTAG